MIHLPEDVRRIPHEVKDLREQITSLETQIESYTQQISRLEYQLAAASSGRQNVADTLVAQTGTQSSADGETEPLREQLARTRAELDAVTTEGNRREEDLRRQLQAVTKELETVKSEIPDSDEVMDDLQELKENSMPPGDDYERKMGRLTEEKIGLEEWIKDLQRDADESRIKLAGVTDALNKAVEDVKTQSAKHEAELDEKNNITMKINEQASKKIEDAKRQVEEAHSKAVEKIKDARREADEKIKDARREADQANKRADEANAKTCELKTNLEDRQAQSEGQLRDKVKVLQTQTVTDEATLQVELEKKRNKLKSDEDEIVHILRDLQQRVSDQKKLQAELAKAKNCTVEELTKHYENISEGSRSEAKDKTQETKHQTDREEGGAEGCGREADEVVKEADQDVQQTEYKREENKGVKEAADAREEVAPMKEEVAAAKKEVAAMKDKADEEEKKAEKATKEAAAMREIADKATKEAAAMREIADKATEEAAAMKAFTEDTLKADTAKVQNLEQELVDVRQILDSKVKEINQVATNNNELRKATKTAEEQMRAIRGELKEAKQQSASDKIELENLRIQLTASESMLEIEMKKLKNANKKMDDLQRKVVELGKELQVTKESNEGAITYDDDINKAHNEARKAKDLAAEDEQTLQQELAEAKRDLETVRSTAKKLEKCIEHHKTESENSRGEVGGLENQVATLQDELEEARHKRDEAYGEAASHKLALEDLQSKIAGKEVRSSNAEEKIATLNKQVAEAVSERAQAIDQASKAVERAAKLGKFDQHVTEDLEEARSELSEAKGQVANYEDELKKLKAKLVKDRVEQGDAKRNIKDLEQALEKSENISKELETQVTGQVNELERSSPMNLQKPLLDEDQSDLQTRAKKAKPILEALAATIHNDRPRKEVEDLHKKWMEADQCADDIQGKLATTIEQLTMRDIEVNTLQQKLDRSESKAEGLEKLAADLRTELENAKDESYLQKALPHRTRNQNDLRIELEKVKETLANLQIQSSKCTETPEKLLTKITEVYQRATKEPQTNHEENREIRQEHLEDAKKVVEGPQTRIAEHRGDGVDLLAKEKADKEKLQSQLRQLQNDLMAAQEQVEDLKADSEKAKISFQEYITQSLKAGNCRRASGACTQRPSKHRQSIVKENSTVKDNTVKDKITIKGGRDWRIEHVYRKNNSYEVNLTRKGESTKITLRQLLMLKEASANAMTLRHYFQAKSIPIPRRLDVCGIQYKGGHYLVFWGEPPGRAGGNTRPSDLKKLGRHVAELMDSADGGKTKWVDDFDRLQRVREEKEKLRQRGVIGHAD